VTRYRTRPRKVSRRNSAASHLIVGDAGTPKHAALKNHILRQLTASDRETLLAEADYIGLPVGETFTSVGDPISTAYFPDSGVISLVSEMRTGHQVAVAAVGAEGVVGVDAIFGIRHYPHSSVVLLGSRGYRLAADRFRRVFQQSETMRRATLAHVGDRMWELATAAACNRVHSYRQRLARWLLITTDKARQPSIPITHETLAQMVGGPRHAVTVALSELRAKGAIAHLRGRIDILQRSVLVEQACECYVAPAGLLGP